MARTIISITDWNNVNWDEVDFEHFDQDSLMDASISQVAEFWRRCQSWKQEDTQGETDIFAEVYFKKALIAGRDPRSDRLFGKYKTAYDKLIFQHIPVHQKWDLTGIEEWSEEHWKEIEMDLIFFRPFYVDKSDPNWPLLSRHHFDFREFMQIPDRYITSIEDWNQVMWLYVDFEHFDESSLDPASVPDHFIKEYQSERSLYRMIYRDYEASRRQWDEVDFTQWNWSGPQPEIGSTDRWNHRRAREAEDAWRQKQREIASERQRVEQAQRVAVEQVRQAGIVLPDEP